MSKSLARRSPVFGPAPFFGGGSVLDDLFESIFSPRDIFGRDLNAILPVSPVRTEQKEDGSSVVTVNLAGFRKEDIKVHVDTAQHVLHVKAETGEEGEDSKSARKFSTSFRLNEYVKPEDVAVAYEHGLLTLTITPPTEEDKEKDLVPLEIK